MSSPFRYLLFFLPIVMVGGILLLTRPDSPEPKKPVAITAQSVTYPDLASLVAAADVIVVARAAEMRSGRVVGSPTDPSAAIKTQLVTLKVGDVLRGENVAASSSIVLEEEAALADGTPIVVNGARPTKVGDEGIFFLTAGKTPEFTNYALLNGQSRYLVTGKRRDALVASSSDPLSTHLARLGPYELRCQISTAAGKPVC